MKIQTRKNSVWALFPQYASKIKKLLLGQTDLLSKQLFTFVEVFVFTRVIKVHTFNWITDSWDAAN